jgi:hypothetical protein
MKTLLLSLFAVAIAAAPAFGEDSDEYKQPKQRNHYVPPAPQRQVNVAPRHYTPPKVQNQSVPTAEQTDGYGAHLCAAEKLHAQCPGPPAQRVHARRPRRTAD